MQNHSVLAFICLKRAVCWPEVNGEGVAAGLSLAQSGAYVVLQLRGLATIPHNQSTAVIAPLKLEAGTGGPVRYTHIYILFLAFKVFMLLNIQVLIIIYCTPDLFVI